MTIASFALDLQEIRQTMNSTVVLSPSSWIRTADGSIRDAHLQDSHETGVSPETYTHQGDSDLGETRSDDDHSNDSRLQSACR